ncbi:sensor histidine kinase [Streptomyces sp. TRM66268-LWL]|uniref:histidine kinase n=1 Tax=Streptomyces polyasparticus TaxID=2767826 RepID=A0ABR7SEG9_9ACTN|nr:sensor histidine kinase [Streptomyces polyasparticus]MBC9712841.1 sensor histidine kinase [Streptomyces polyasparticus]
MSGTPPSPAALRARRPVAVEVLAWCAGVVYPVLLAIAAINEPELTGARLLPSALLAVLLVPLVLRRPLPALVLLVTGSFAATVLARDVYPDWPQGWQIAYLQALFTDLVVGYVAAARSRRTGVVAAALALCTQIAAVPYYRSGADNTVSTVLTLILALATAWLVGHSVAERSRHAHALREQAAAQAVTAERLRIARELHDMVAHSIGIIAIQAGVGRRVIDTQPAEARNALGAIESTSRETLSGLRRMLGALRQSEGAPLEPAPALADLDRLVAAAGDAGVWVELRRTGEQRALAPELELSAYRIVQEAVTNVVRHAGIPACEVSLDYGVDALAVTVTDKGRGAVLADEGYGIVGMRERVALLGGSFEAGPRPEGGFRVSARLPVPPGPLSCSTEER